MIQVLSLVGRRFAWMTGILLALSFVLFGLLSALPGDPIDLLITSNPQVRAEDIARLKKLRGLDRPWPVGWVRWLVGHPEAIAPPSPPDDEVMVTEMPLEGPARVWSGGNEWVFDTPGVHQVLHVVEDQHGQQTVARTEVLVAPSLSPLPSDAPSEATELDDSSRQLGGSTEDSSGVGGASEGALVTAARKLGSPLPLAATLTISADDSGAAMVTTEALSPGHAGLRFEVISGAGRFLDGAWRHRFTRSGQSAVIYRATDLDGRTAQGAFIVEHGLLVDDTRYHRGALFVLLGDTEALGYSSTYKRPVWELLFGATQVMEPGDTISVWLARSIQGFGRVQNTLALMLPALLLSLLLAVPLGLLAAARRGSWLDTSISMFSTVGLATPAFWLGIMAMVIFAAQLHWLPASGVQTPGLAPVLSDVLIDRLRHAVLPVCVLSVAWCGQWTRYIRASVLEVLPHDFVRTAKAKGLPRYAVLLRHALGNALIPLVTVVALAAPQLFAGALLTETVFAWPGVGRLQYEAILNNDSYVAIVVFLVSAALVLLANLGADLVCLLVDPRQRRVRHQP